MRAPEGLLRTPVSQVKCEGDRNHPQASRQLHLTCTPRTAQGMIKTGEYHYVVKVSGSV
jgi:hypothetical protein